MAYTFILGVLVEKVRSLIKGDAILLGTNSPNTNDTYDTASIELFSVGLERVEAGRELGVTPGKPVKDIMKATKAYRKGTTVTGSAITIEIDVEDDLLTDK